MLFLSKFNISRETLERLYWREELSFSQIARKLGVSPALARKRMKQYSIPRRNLSEATKCNLPKMAFKKGDTPWNKDKTGVYSPECILRMSERMKGSSIRKGHKATEKTRLKISLGHLGHKPWNKGKTGIHLSPETEFKEGEHNSPRTEFKRGHKLSPEQLQRRSKTFKEHGISDEQRKRMLQGIGKKPTKPERELTELISSNKLPFKYVGNGEFILGGKCPDFLNVNGKKQLIELFGTYWHPIFDVAKRTEHFRQYGFKTLIIWEDELRNNNKVIRKIKSFSRSAK